MTVSATGLIQWVPVSSQAAADGKPHTISVTVSDDDGAEAAGTFTVSVKYNPNNGVPSAPVALSPSSGTESIGRKPVLIVLNAKDPDEETLTYEFEVRAGSIEGEQVAGAGAVASGEGATRFQVTEELAAGVYAWRARAKDGRGAVGPWSEVASFQVTEVKAEEPKDEGGCSSAGGAFGGLLPLLMVALGLRRRRQ
jgi:hypothetical protein